MERFEEGPFCSADVIINILSRQREPTALSIMTTPQGLRLRQEPLADCARYESDLHPGFGPPGWGISRG